ncbi:hypothetical protein SY85_23680 [Flavisolibacter tropicus]|uniref:Uncharacterized protein n=1 Tax=Flavisolibacter tropicus TaxID=1492898 RepID=A0A172U203_9BACT|nr:hypothetical protein SY85_23680 [Flavisolibacter tropicus]
MSFKPFTLSSLTSKFDIKHSNRHQFVHFFLKVNPEIAQMPTHFKKAKEDLLQEYLKYFFYFND